jgi:hypothetical protein
MRGDDCDRQVQLFVDELTGAPSPGENMIG